MLGKFTLGTDASTLNLCPLSTMLLTSSDVMCSPCLHIHPDGSGISSMASLFHPPRRGEGTVGGKGIAYGMGWLERGYMRVQRVGRSLGKSDTRPQLLELGACIHPAV